MLNSLRTGCITLRHHFKDENDRTRDAIYSYKKKELIVGPGTTRVFTRTFYFIFVFLRSFDAT